MQIIEANPNVRVSFSDLLDLANERVGGRVLECSDDFFAEKENLIKNAPAVFIQDKYTERGKWMDGWESRRKRTEGYDWCVLQLGVEGFIKGFNVDTSFFTGNYPEACMIEGSNDGKNFEALTAKTKLQGGSHNFIPVQSEKSTKYIRLNIYPDGGVARLRVFGLPNINWQALSKSNQLIDLALSSHGGTVVSCSDMYFGNKDNLLFPNAAPNMGEGWETKRSRGAHEDWIIIRLGHEGTIQKICIDTNHFKGNFPDRCKIEATHAPLDYQSYDFRDKKITWTEILPVTKLSAHSQLTLEKELKNNTGKFTHIKMTIIPDGGISRLRVFGKI